MNDDRYRTLLGAFSAVADQPTVKAVLHSLRGVLASTSKLHGVELYLLNNDGQTLSSFEFDRDDDAPAIKLGAQLLRVGAVARVLDEQKPVLIPESQKVAHVPFKVFRGMASVGAVRDRLDLEDAGPRELEALGAEGLEVSVPVRGSVRTIIRDMLKHLCSAISYGGVSTLREFRQRFWAEPEQYLILLTHAHSDHIADLGDRNGPGCVRRGNHDSGGESSTARSERPASPTDEVGSPPLRRGETSSQHRADSCHFAQRAIRIARCRIDASDCVGEQDDAQAGAQCVDRGLLHAVLGRQPGDEQRIDVSTAQVVQQRQSIRRVPIEGRVPRAIGIVTLADDDRRGRKLEVWMKRSAR